MECTATYWEGHVWAFENFCRVPRLNEKGALEGVIKFARLNIAAVNGLKVFPEAITSIFPKAQVQETCIVHMVCHSLRCVPWKDRKQAAADLKAIYRAKNAEAAGDRLGAFEEKWDRQYPSIGQFWRHNWEQIIPSLP